MSKLLTTILLLFLVATAWTQAGGEKDYIPVATEIYIPDSLQLEIHSEFGWNLCAGGELELYTDYTSETFEWLRNDTLLNHAESNLTVHQGGLYQVRILEDDSLIYSAIVEVYVNQPVVPTIVYEGNVLSSSTAAAYQWYKNDVRIENATEQSLYLLESGDYFVETTDENGCVASSEVISLTVANIHEVELQSIETYPSPTRDKLYVTPVNIDNQDFVLSLFSQNGKLLQEVKGRLRDNQRIELNLEDLPIGTYFLQFLGEKVQVMEQVAKF